MADVFRDVYDMHEHYRVHEAVDRLSDDHKKKLLDFRRDFLMEEMRELDAAIASSDPEGVVDSLIDLIVVAAGTLDIFGVDGSLAWDEVHFANMSKRVGIKPNRPNPLGLPDLVKPEGWVAPDHGVNHGTLDVVLSSEEDQPSLPLNPPTDIVK